MFTGEPPAWEMTQHAATMDNVEDSAEFDSIDDVVLKSPSPPDRLPPMLFLAALIHGILIIGVTFNAVLDDIFREAISLEVVAESRADRLRRGLAVSLPA